MIANNTCVTIPILFNTYRNGPPSILGFASELFFFIQFNLEQSFSSPTMFIYFSYCLNLEG